MNTIEITKNDAINSATAYAVRSYETAMEKLLRAAPLTSPNHNLTEQILAMDSAIENLAKTRTQLIPIRSIQNTGKIEAFRLQQAR